MQWRGTSRLLQGNDFLDDSTWCIWTVSSFLPPARRPHPTMGREGGCLDLSWVACRLPTHWKDYVQWKYICFPMVGGDSWYMSPIMTYKGKVYGFAESGGQDTLLLQVISPTFRKTITESTSRTLIHARQLKKTVSWPPGNMAQLICIAAHGASHRGMFSRFFNKWIQYRQYRRGVRKHPKFHSQTALGAQRLEQITATSVSPYRASTDKWTLHVPPWVITGVRNFISKW